MILSHGRKYIFVHVPKTGGTSLALALESRAMKEDVMLGDTPKASKRRNRLKDLGTRGRLWKHSTLADIDGLISPDEIAQMFCFTMVRNPWDRMVSYYHWLQGQSFDHEVVGLAKTLGFGEFLNTPQVSAGMQQIPYRYYMTDATGVERAALYIRLEHFEQDAEPLWEHLGFRLDLPHENASDRARDYRTYYGESESRRVAELCREDIERFGYSF